MKIYISYFSTAFFNFWLIAFYLGFSAGFASYIPILALLGAILLFIVAIPILIYNSRSGVIAGLLACLMLLAYGMSTFLGVIEDGVFNWGILILTPFVLTLISIYLSLNVLVGKKQVPNIPKDKIIRLILSSVPTALFILYLIFYGEFWNINEFKI
ncbi:hypothetical protein [Siphonobacter sp. SORGH_AS_1065]|uniref:hypothetical protein n=1 Tax=Siphonobacter sp. SORGH_AS_1065 TaxID=3041795 RepID=UPI002789BA95|nr:hypothetical protein [Siphonobacter sp. SORGH_AS_1065]MDQ1087573.1 membrane-associated protease RseP (regulator of RpoE activity) [Siphonobacter sp. SORGH_AS_1065]